MTYRLNTYFAVLIITLFGAGAASVIVRVANADTSAIAALGTNVPVVHETGAAVR